MTRIGLSLFLICCVVLASSCDWIWGGPEKSINDVLASIDKAINDINVNSAEWQNIIRQLQKDLKGSIDSTIEGELTRFVEHSAAVVANQVVCTADILSKRAINFLNKLEQAIKGNSQKTNLTSPIICQVSSNIELSATPTGHRIIEASGADFTIRDNNNQLLAVAFWSDSKQKAFNVEESRIGRNTNYNLAINLDGEDVPALVKENDINKLLFYWNGSNIDQPQVLVTKKVPGSNEVTVGIGDVGLTPRHTGGDTGTDINDDNPFQTDLIAKVFISEDKRHVMYNLYMNGRESQPDHTSVEGWKSEKKIGEKKIKLPFGGEITIPLFGEGPGVVAYTAPDGWVIVSVTPVGETKDHINITKHGDQNLPEGGAGQVVRNFKVNGGEGGGEAGNQTGVVATFNNLTVKIKENND